MTRSALKLAVVSLVALLGACSDTPQGPSQAEIDKQIDDRFNALPQPAKAASVQGFTVSPASVKAGETATLTWAVSDAIAVSVKDGDGHAIAGVDPTALAGSATVTPDHDTTYVLQAQGEGGNDFALVRVTVAQKPLVLEPAPLLFAALPLEVNAGEPAYLVWNSPENVLVTDDANTELSAASKVGSLAVKPLKDTTYTAKTNTTPAQTVTATVKVNPTIGVFTSDKTGAVSGEGVKLRWITAGADTVVLSERTRGVLYTAKSGTERNDFTFDDSVPPNLPSGTVLVYSLAVKNANMSKTAELSVAVTTDPKITEFTAPAAVTRGGTTKPKLTWKTANGTALEIYSGSTGTTATRLEYRAPATAIASGSIDLPLPAVDTDYQLVLTGDLGGRVTQTVTLKLVAAPSITSFTSNPATKVVNAGDKATLTFVAQNATSVAISVVGSNVIYTTTTKSAGDSVDVYPGQPTTYRLVAKNDAGDTAEKTLPLGVDAPLNVTVSPFPSLPGEQVTFNWDFTGTSATGITAGNLNGATPVTGKFEELFGSPNAKELTVSEKDDAVADLTFPDGFTFRFYGVPYTMATVSTNGWLSFTKTTSTYSSNPSTSPYVPATAAPNNVVALLWDDLELDATDGKILYELRGTAPNRKLIIEYFHNRAYGESATEVTAEFVLNENGSLELQYGTITDISTGAFTATIGAENQGGTDGVRVGQVGCAGTGCITLPASGTGYVLFGAAASPGSMTLKPSVAGTFELFASVPTASGGTIDVPVRTEVKFIDAASLPVTEVLYKPVAAPAGALGQWFEIANKSGTALKLDDLTVSTAANTIPLPLGTGTFAPDQVLVVGQSKNTAENGGVNVDVALSTLVLGATSDTIKLFVRGTQLTSFTYDDATISVPAGTSLSDPAGLTYTKTGSASACTANVTPNAAGTTASPGTLVPVTCGTWTVSRSAKSLVGTTDGTVVLSNFYWKTKKVTFPSGFTFPFDGQDRSELFIATGYLTFDTSLTEGSDPYSDNPTTFPTSSKPNGVIAPFWDESSTSTRTDTVIRVKYFVNPDGNAATKDGYAVFEWVNENVYTYSSLKLNYEAILYENGDVEFLYGLMDPGSTTASYISKAKGAGASIGISNVAGTEAVVVGHNKEVISSYSGYYFKK